MSSDNNIYNKYEKLNDKNMELKANKLGKVGIISGLSYFGGMIFSNNLIMGLSFCVLLPTILTSEYFKEKAYKEKNKTIKELKESLIEKYKKEDDKSLLKLNYNISEIEYLEELNLENKNKRSLISNSITIGVAVLSSPFVGLVGTIVCVFASKFLLDYILKEKNIKDSARNIINDHEKLKLIHKEKNNNDNDNDNYNVIDNPIKRKRIGI